MSVGTCDRTFARGRRLLLCPAFFSAVLVSPAFVLSLFFSISVFSISYSTILLKMWRCGGQVRLPLLYILRVPSPPSVF